MAITTADLIVGPARVFYAPEGETIPDKDSVGFGASWGGNWTEVGGTVAPVAIRYEFEEGEAMVEQSTLVLKRWKTAEKATIETVLGELSAAHLNLALEGTITTAAAGASTVGYEELDLGDDPIMTVRSWGIEGRYIDANGADFPIRVFIHRATSMINGDLEFNKADVAGIPLQIKALGDLTQAAGERLMKIEKVTAAATG